MASDGSVWLQSNQLLAGENHWTVLGRDGRVVAWVALPSGLEKIVISGKRIYGVRLDELDRPSVVVLEW